MASLDASSLTVSQLMAKRCLYLKLGVLISITSLSVFQLVFFVFSVVVTTGNMRARVRRHAMAGTYSCKEERYDFWMVETTSIWIARMKLFA